MNKDIYLDLNEFVGKQRGKLLIGNPYKRCLRRTLLGRVCVGDYYKDYRTVLLNQIKL